MKETRRSKYALEHMHDEELADAKYMEDEMLQFKQLKEKILRALRSMTNAKLLDVTLEAHIPDYYDGEWTKQGEWYKNAATKILKSRLDEWLGK